MAADRSTGVREFVGRRGVESARGTIVRASGLRGGSDLLGDATACGWLAAWALSATRYSTLVPRHAALAAPFFFAISPIAVHGGVLGRPDHQSLVILLLAIVIGAEVRLMQTGRSAKWSMIGGIAGGLAMFGYGFN